MKDILISTAIILFIGLFGSLLFQALTAPDMPVTGAVWHQAISHEAAFVMPGARQARALLLAM